MNIFINTIFFTIIPLPLFARCAVCYTDGLSGASITVMVIVFSFILLFVGNKLLQKFLEKN